MTAQMRHMLAVAALPDVTLQVLPAVAHPATGSEIIIADEWALARGAPREIWRLTASALCAPTASSGAAGVSPRSGSAPRGG